VVTKGFPLAPLLLRQLHSMVDSSYYKRGEKSAWNACTFSFHYKATLKKASSFCIIYFQVNSLICIYL